MIISLIVGISWNVIKFAGNDAGNLNTHATTDMKMMKMVNMVKMI